MGLLGEDKGAFLLEALEEGHFSFMAHSSLLKMEDRIFKPLSRP